MPVRIALVQFQSQRYDIEANLAKADRFVERAVELHVDIVVFPEMFLTGWGPRIREMAAREEEIRTHFCTLAAQHGIDIIPGSFPELEADNLYNTAWYIDAGGNILMQYRKVYLWITEKERGTPGDGPVVCDTAYGRVGLAICWDLAFPELFRGMFRKGADMVFCPSCWCAEDAGPGQALNAEAETLFVDSLCVARAFENECAIAFINAAGQWPTEKASRTSIGHSQVTIPFQGPIARAATNREELLVCSVDLSVRSVAEEAYGIRKDVSDPPVPEIST